MGFSRFLDDVGVRNMWLYRRPPVEATARDIEALLSARAEDLHVPVRAAHLAWAEARDREGLREERFSFPSPRPSGHAAVDTVRGTRWSRRGAAAAGRSAVILTHGAYAASMQKPRLFLPDVRAAEWDTYALELPHHMTRQRAESRYSGEFMVTADVCRITHGILQADAEIRALVLALREAGYDRIVIGGISIGASPTMQALVNVEVDGAFGIVPSVDAYTGLWASLLGECLRPVGHAAGITDEIARRVLRIITPAALGPPRIAPGRVLLVCGLHDLVCVPAESFSLSAAWGGCRLHALDAGHASLIMQYPRVRRLVGAWVEHCFDRR